DIVQIALELALVDGWPHIYRFIQPIADFQLFCTFHVTIHEFPIHTLLHDDAAGCRAALAGGAERSPKTAFDGEIKVCVIEHDHGILAAHLERAMFETLCSHCADGASHSA